MPFLTYYSFGTALLELYNIINNSTFYSLDNWKSAELKVQFANWLIRP